MELIDLVSLINPPASWDQIHEFEEHYHVILPEQYRQLLLLSNGVEVGGQFPHPTIDNWNLIIGPYIYSLDDLRNSFIQLENLERIGIKYQHQDKVLKIGSTHDGPSVLIGWKGNMTGKIYLTGPDELINDSEMPLYFVSESLIDFLILIKKNNDYLNH